MVENLCVGGGDDSEVYLKFMDLQANHEEAMDILRQKEDEVVVLRDSLEMAEARISELTRDVEQLSSDVGLMADFAAEPDSVPDFEEGAVATPRTKEALLEVFELFDSGEKEIIVVADLRRAADMLGKDATDDLLEAMIGKVSGSGNGVDEDTFERLLVPHWPDDITPDTPADERIEAAFDAWTDALGIERCE